MPAFSIVCHLHKQITTASSSLLLLHALSSCVANSNTVPVNEVLQEGGFYSCMLWAAAQRTATPSQSTRCSRKALTKSALQELQRAMPAHRLHAHRSLAQQCCQWSQLKNKQYQMFHFKSMQIQHFLLQPRSNARLSTANQTTRESRRWMRVFSA